MPTVLKETFARIFLDFWPHSDGRFPEWERMTPAELFVKMRTDLVQACHAPISEYVLGCARGALYRLENAESCSPDPDAAYDAAKLAALTLWFQI